MIYNPATYTFQPPFIRGWKYKSCKKSLVFAKISGIVKKKEGVIIRLIMDILKYFFSGICVGVTCIVSALKLYDVIDGVKETLIAAFFGAPVCIVSVGLFIFSIVKIARKML